MSELSVVNVVGSGSLGIELDLDLLAEDLGPNAEYTPVNYPGIHLRFEENSTLVTLYRTGNYTITGAESKSEAHDGRELFLSKLSTIGVIDRSQDTQFEIVNLVCTGEVAMSLELSALTIGLGMENTEYEPEQFSGLIYRLPESGLVALIFGTGKIVITGTSNREHAEEAFQELQNDLDSLV